LNGAQGAAGAQGPKGEDGKGGGPIDCRDICICGDICGFGGGGFPLRATAGHYYEMGETITNDDRGSALIYNNGKVYLSTTPNDKKSIGFLGYIIIGSRTSNTDISFNQVAYVVGIGDSKEWKNEQDIDSSGNVVNVRKETISGIKVCNENGNIEAGDYLTTSSKKGFYMKQSDDILRNYTSAKAVDDIIFDSTGEKTNVYAIMLSG